MKMRGKALLLAGLLLCGAAHGNVLPLVFEPAGPQKMPGREVCRDNPALASGNDTAAMTALLAGPEYASVRPLFSAAQPQVMWWIRKAASMDLQALLTAFHEANHMLDFALSACHGNRAVFHFRGQVHVTDYVRGQAPGFALAAREIPAEFKAQPNGRYAVYFGNPNVYRGDFFPLIDELNAHVAGAEFEVAIADTPVYREMASRANSIDGNISGMADFMLYTVAYLKALRTSDPDAWQRLVARKQMMAHVQRLWTAAEAVLAKAAPLAPEHGGLYRYPSAALNAAYAPAMLAELEAAGIHHGGRAPQPKPRQ
ncbi:hypothetical protein IP92_04309 [Pseudoduganella flava]|uniref:Uncharacterized protein n=1 Tax=Pseudoduganella flava TaxID=871742 RepID=A0A562PIT4_9BURK|nr:hypothetical protein [Pseudoduganella flava]QGZ41947.1 hypothetical protein GO485_24775 [Pseudoduganella flava]TWI44361.1 hypothetical protein IP92_04309 [Pseudoduganella flava]